MKGRSDAEAASGLPSFESGAIARAKGRKEMTNAIIFDLDGLMFDTKPTWIAAWGPAFSEEGLQFDKKLLPQFFGASQEAIEQIIAQKYNSNPRAIKAVREHVRIASKAMMDKGAPKKPGLDELLEYAAAQGLGCAVASASGRNLVEAHLAHGKISGFFQAVVAGDYGLPSKPAPDVFLEAARRLHAQPSETLVLEDSEKGIEAASAGGFIPVMVPDMIEPSPEINSMARYVCSSLLDVRNLLAEGML
jgi:HAD superfamily hydrolase (TIGR01509 family)